jgi:proteasome accessory factor A
MEVTFQLTQRADFFEEEVGLETTLKRPIVNTRDEPHCDAQKYRRLHVIVGDANLSEISTFLKVGTTAVVLSMVEDDWFARAGDRDLTLADPVISMRRVSYDLSLTRALELADGRTMTALDMQWELLDLARKYAEDRGLDSVGGEEIGRDILRRWEHVLSALESDPMSLATTLDWVAKYRVINGYRERHGLSWRDPKLVHGPAVPRRAAREVAVRAARDGTPAHRGIGPDGHDRATDDHPGLLPGQMPGTLGLPGGGGQLGLTGL